MIRRVGAFCAAVGLFLAFAAPAHAQSWKTAQASVYGPWEGETITALGTRITDSTKGVAVPWQQVVRKSTWKRHKSAKYRRTHFYYGERIRLRHKVGKRTYTITAKVTDCGGFLGMGTYRRGRWVPRQFDLQPMVFKTLHVSGLGTVTWKWVK